MKFILYNEQKLFATNYLKEECQKDLKSIKPHKKFTKKVAKIIKL